MYLFLHSFFQLFYLFFQCLSLLRKNIDDFFFNTRKMQNRRIFTVWCLDHCAFYINTAFALIMWINIKDIYYARKCSNFLSKHLLLLCRGRSITLIQLLCPNEDLNRGQREVLTLFKVKLSSALQWHERSIILGDISDTMCVKNSISLWPTVAYC